MTTFDTHAGAHRSRFGVIGGVPPDAAALDVHQRSNPRNGGSCGHPRTSGTPSAYRRGSSASIVIEAPSLQGAAPCPDALRWTVNQLIGSAQPLNRTRIRQPRPVASMSAPKTRPTATIATTTDCRSRPAPKRRRTGLLPFLAFGALLAFRLSSLWTALAWLGWPSAGRLGGLGREVFVGAVEDVLDLTA